MTWVLFLAIGVHAYALDLKVQTGPIDKNSVLSQQLEYQRLVSERTRISGELVPLQQRVHSAFGNKANLSAAISNLKNSCSIYAKEKEEIIFRIQSSLSDEQVVHYSEDKTEIPEISDLLDRGSDLKGFLTYRLKSAISALANQAIGEKSQSARRASNLAYTNRASLKLSCWDELMVKAHRSEPYRVICNYLGKPNCLGVSSNSIKPETDRVEIAIQYLMNGVSPDEIRNGFWRRILGEPSLKKKAKFAFNRWSKVIEDEYPQVQSCKSRYESASARYIDLKDRYYGSLSSLQAAWEQEDSSVFDSNVLATKRKFAGLLRELEHQAVELPMLHGKIKECSNTSSLLEAFTGEQRAITRLKTEVDVRSVRLLQLSRQMANLEKAAEELVGLKQGIVRAKDPVEAAKLAMRALVLTHQLDSSSTRKFPLNLRGANSDVFSLKTTYEVQIARTLWQGKQANYHASSNNIFDLLNKNEVQCYSGSLIFSYFALQQFPNLLGAEKKPVVVLTPGHILPGFVITENGQRILYGIETTATGPAKIKYGPTQNVKGEIRVVALEDFLVVEALKYDITNLLEVLNGTLSKTERLGFKVENLKPYDNNSRKFGQLSRLNQTPFGFGQANVPTGPVPRSHQRFLDRTIDLPITLRAGEGAGESRIADYEARMESRAHLDADAARLRQIFVSHSSRGDTQLQCDVFEITSTQHRYSIVSDGLKFETGSQYVMQCKPKYEYCIQPERPSREQLEEVDRLVSVLYKERFDSRFRAIVQLQIFSWDGSCGPWGGRG